MSPTPTFKLILSTAVTGSKCLAISTSSTAIALAGTGASRQSSPADGEGQVGEPHRPGGQHRDVGRRGSTAVRDVPAEGSLVVGGEGCGKVAQHRREHAGRNPQPAERGKREPQPLLSA